MFAEEIKEILEKKLNIPFLIMMYTEESDKVYLRGIIDNNDSIAGIIDVCIWNDFSIDSSPVPMKYCIFDNVVLILTYVYGNDFTPENRHYLTKSYTEIPLYIISVIIECMIESVTMNINKTK